MPKYGVEATLCPRKGQKNVVITRPYYEPPTITYPRGMSQKRLLELPRVVELLQDLKRVREMPVLENAIGEGYRTHSYEFHYIEGKDSKFSVEEVEDKDNEEFDYIYITIPKGEEIESYRVQRLALEVLRRALTFEARTTLPTYVAEQASIYEIEYNGVRIVDSLRRWGSCSSNGRLSFSFYAMLLPLPFVNYLVWHELTHLQFMDHGPEFWCLLSEYLQYNAREMDIALRECELNMPKLF